MKELRIKDGILYQTPVSALQNLRGPAELFHNKIDSSNCYELELTIPGQKSLTCSYLPTKREWPKIESGYNKRTVKH